MKKGCCIECGRDKKSCSNKGIMEFKDGTMCCQQCFEMKFFKLDEHGYEPD